jgi:predicted dehydrogenase
MENLLNNRRNFLKNSLSGAAGVVLSTSIIQEISAKTQSLDAPYLHKNLAPRIRFSAIGINHGHIYGMVDAVTRGGGELISVYAKEPELLAAFTKRYPSVKVAKSEAEILEDPAIQLIMSSGIARERAPLGVRAMKHGKDFLSDKPGITTLEQLAEVRKVQKATKKIFSILYSEHFENKATVKAGELVQQGAIGKVIQTIGLGPHKIALNARPPWFFDKNQFGGILTDIGSHQVDQFLFFTGSTQAEVVASQTGNVHHPQYPLFEDFGDMMLKGNGGTGYVRVDWFTPSSLKVFGDGRLTILGTEGYIELRKYVDIANREKGNNLYLVNNKEASYIDCNEVVLPFGEQFVNDVVNRTETAMTQKHCFLAMELAIKAEKFAKKLDLKGK